MPQHASLAISVSGTSRLNRYLEFDGRFLTLALSLVLWSVVYWQLHVPVHVFLQEASRIRMKLPSHLEFVRDFNWWPIAITCLLVGFAFGPRLRWLQTAFLVGVPLFANVGIHLSLHLAQGSVARVMMRQF